MKTLSLLFITLFCTISAIAQPWIGSTAGNIYYNLGNVGIGYTDADYKLKVNGTGYFNGATTFASSITATSATFTGLLSLNLANSGTNSYHPLNRNAITTENMFMWVTGGSPKWYLGQRSKNSEDGFSLFSTAKGDDVLYFNPSGAATFASPINIANTLILKPNENNSSKIDAINKWLAIQSDYLQGVGIGYSSDNMPGGFSAKLWVNGGIYNSGILVSTGAATFYGNVGIGTTNPTYLLDIAKANGTEYNSASQLRINSVTSGNRVQILLTDGINSDGKISYLPSPSATSRRLTLSASVNESDFVIRGDGNVGIGTTNPEAKLTVKGKIVASEIQVKDILSIADYVFKPDYQLMSLEKVEDFVKQNQHLPEVPSEKEFKKDGMNVAEMNALLLKKVEELTLYAIEQNKQMIEQNKQIYQLKEENKIIMKMIAK